MSPVDLPKLYTEIQLAKYLGVTPFTLARARRRGEIGCNSVGRGIRYTAEHLAAYLKANERVATRIESSRT